MKRTALTIAGSDSSGGAGVQADIKTMEVNDVYAMSAVTALTAQNTLGVQGVFEVTPECLRQQLESVFSDIFPDAVKIGMLVNKELARVSAEYLEKYGAKHIVIDPVMISSSGTALLDTEAVQVLRAKLFPMAEVITPNLPEAEALTGLKISGQRDMEKAAQLLCREYGGAVVLKGGHAKGSADDLLCLDGKNIWIKGKRIENPNTHGTGCTFSSAIAAGLAHGLDVEASVRLAKGYIQRAVEAGLNLGKGNGPLEHSVGNMGGESEIF